MIPPGLWAVRYPVYRMQCAPECALFVPYPSQTIGNEHARTRIKITIILYKTKQTQTVVSQLAHSFNQRARDSSSLERTKIPRRIARFFVGFSFYTPFARSLHGFHITVGDHQLVGGTGMPQTMEHDAGELRVLCTPSTVPFIAIFKNSADQKRHIAICSLRILLVH